MKLWLIIGMVLGGFLVWKLRASDTNPVRSYRDPELVFAGAYQPRYFPGQPLQLEPWPWSPRYPAYKRWKETCINPSRYGCDCDEGDCYAPGYRH